jgi:hypothetical protein
MGEMKMEDKKQTVSIFTIIIIVILIVIIVLLVYDKLVNNKNSGNNTQNSNLNTNTIIKEDVVKNDISKEYVYTNETKMVSKGEQYTGGKYKVAINIPTINLKSEEADDMNEEIKSSFSPRPTNVEAKEGLYYLTYEYNINKDILSLLITEYQGYDMMPNIKYYSYNIDIKTGKRVYLRKIIERLGNNYDSLNAKFNKLIIDTKNELAVSKGNFSEEKLLNLNTHIKLMDLDTYYISKDGILVWDDNMDVFYRLVNINKNEFVAGIKLDVFESKVESNK